MDEDLALYLTGGLRRKTRWRVTFDILGESRFPVDMKKLASLERAQGAQVDAEELLDRLSALHAENSYERTFETSFERTSNAINTDIVAFKLLLVLLISGVTAFQIRHLSQFLFRQDPFQCSCLPTRAHQVVRAASSRK